MRTDGRTDMVSSVCVDVDATVHTRMAAEWSGESLAITETFKAPRKYLTVEANGAEFCYEDHEIEAIARF